MLYLADFGPDYANLSTVGVTQLDSAGAVVVARSTAGVVPFGNGAYGADLTLDANTSVLQWDTGSGVFAVETTASFSVDYMAVASAVWGFVGRTLTENPGITTADIVAALEATTIPVDAVKMNGANVIGDGSVIDPWRGVGVQP